MLSVEGHVKTKLLTSLALLLVLLAVCSPLFAHHGSATTGGNESAACRPDGRITNNQEKR